MKSTIIDESPYKDYLVLVIYLLVCRAFVMRHFWVCNWVATHFMFSIFEGFYARSFVGTIIHVFAAEHYGSHEAILNISKLITAILSVFLALLSFLHWKKNKCLTSFLIGAVLLTSPGMVQFFAKDSGRFDQIGYIVVILFVIFIKLFRSFKIHLFFMGVISLILVIIHEVFLVLIVPLLHATFYLNYRYARQAAVTHSKLLLLSILAIAPSAVLTFLMLTVARMDYNVELIYVTFARMQGMADFYIDINSLMIHFRSISSSMTYTYEKVFSVARASSIITVLLALLPSFAVALLFLRRSLSEMKTDNRKSINMFMVYIYGCCLSPVILFFIGHDYSRWMAGVIFNLFILGITNELLRSYGNRPKVEVVHPVLNAGLIVVVIFSLFMGPISAAEHPSSMNSVAEKIEELLSGTSGFVK